MEKYKFKTVCNFIFILENINVFFIIRFILNLFYKQQIITKYYHFFLFTYIYLHA